MRMLKLIGAIAGLIVMGAAAAHAAPGVSTANVNVRTGPDTDFPSVGVIPEGDDVEIAGCLRDESWCDVIWAGNRGWVYSEYLAFDQRGEYVPLPDVGPEAFRVPFVTFVASDYWGRYYVGRPWWGERDRWFASRSVPASAGTPRLRARVAPAGGAAAITHRMVWDRRRIVGGAWSAARTGARTAVTIAATAVRTDATTDVIGATIGVSSIRP